jgi:hypothetical protein
VSRHAWLAGVLALALGLSLVPLLLVACCAPAGATGLGTVWFINDFAQYESALRQGADPTHAGWLIRDVFTAEPHQPAFMFSLYVGLGKLAALTQLPPMLLERVTEVLARIAFVMSLWRFCRAFATSLASARAAFLLALFGSGLEFPAALVSAALGLGSTYAGSWSYETNSFGLLFAAPHVPLAGAATLELARGWLLPVRGPGLQRWLAAAGLGAILALVHPFHAPVLFAAMVVAGCVFWRTGRGTANLAGALVAMVGALPILGATVSTFSTDPFWSATYTAQNLLPSPAPHELIVDLGVTLLLALGGLLVWRSGPLPFGLSLWILFALVAMYLPVPYQRRLSFGVHPAVAVLAGNALLAAAASMNRRRAALVRQGVAGLAVSGTLIVFVSMVGSSLWNTPLPVYRSSLDLDAAIDWLDQRAGSGDVILADWQVDNYLAPRVHLGSAFGGHPVATLHPDEKKFEIATLFAHGGNLDLARRLGASWLVFGPDEAALAGPGEPVFQSGNVRVYHVEGPSS